MRTHCQHFTGSANTVKELATLDAQGGQAAIGDFSDVLYHY